MHNFSFKYPIPNLNNRKLSTNFQKIIPKNIPHISLVNLKNNNSITNTLSGSYISFIANSINNINSI